MPEKEKVAEVKEVVKEATKFGEIYTIVGLTINIPTEDRRTSYFVGDIAFECKDGKALEEITKRDKQVRDIIIGIIMTKRKEQLLNNDYVEDTLKVEIRKEINGVLYGIEEGVRNVFLSERIVQ